MSGRKHFQQPRLRKLKVVRVLHVKLVGTADGARNLLLIHIELGVR